MSTQTKQALSTLRDHLAQLESRLYTLTQQREGVANQIYILEQVEKAEQSTPPAPTEAPNAISE